MSPLTFNMLTLALPLVVLIVVGRIRLRRRAAAQERTGVVELPFEPADPPAPGFLLCRFTLQQQTYLRRQKGILLSVVILFGWVFLSQSSAALLPSFIAIHGLAQGGAISIWHSYLFQVGNAGAALMGIFAILSGFLAVSEISMALTARYPRTRPLTRSFIYWSKVLPGLAAIITAYVVASALSFVLLILFYGPVYKHLEPDQAPVVKAVQLGNAHTTLGGKTVALGSQTPGPINPVPLTDAQRQQIKLHKRQAKQYLRDVLETDRTLQTSLPRLLLAGLTCCILGFSLAVAAVMQPFRFLRGKLSGAVLIWGGVLGNEFLNIGLNVFTPRFGRVLFLYNHLGPPPPYINALVPILLAAFFLFLGSIFSNRLET